MTCAKINSIQKLSKTDKEYKKIKDHNKLRVSIDNIQCNNRNEIQETELTYDFLTESNLIKINSSLEDEDKNRVKHMINNMRANYFKESLISKNSYSVVNMRHLIDAIPKFEENAMIFIDIMNKKLNEFERNLERKVFEEIFIDCRLPNNNQNRIDVSKLIPIGYNHNHQFVAYFNISKNKVCMLPINLYSFFVHYLPKWKDEQLKLEQEYYYE